MSPFLAFLAWGDFYARSRFARSTIPEEKWGTTRSLVLSVKRVDCFIAKIDSLTKAKKRSHNTGF